MVDLFCTPFVDLIQRMRLEFRNQQAVFDLPVRKWYMPAADGSTPDLSVRFHDRVAGNASGPASGPQSQMAQNLVLSWLGGGRIMELKTVQVNDELKISRPCIEAANVGYNIEWSPERCSFTCCVAHPKFSAIRSATPPWPAPSANQSTTCRSAMTWPASKRRK